MFWWLVGVGLVVEILLLVVGQVQFCSTVVSNFQLELHTHLQLEVAGVRHQVLEIQGQILP